MTVYLSLGNPAGTVPEDRGAMLVLVNLVGELDTTVTVTVKTEPGTGENAYVYLFKFIRFTTIVYFQLWQALTTSQCHMISSLIMIRTPHNVCIFLW